MYVRRDTQKDRSSFLNRFVTPQGQSSPWICYLHMPPEPWYYPMDTEDYRLSRVCASNCTSACTWRLIVRGGLWLPSGGQCGHLWGCLGLHVEVNSFCVSVHITWHWAHDTCHMTLHSWPLIEPVVTAFFLYPPQGEQFSLLENGSDEYNYCEALTDISSSSTFIRCLKPNLTLWFAHQCSA